MDSCGAEDTVKKLLETPEVWFAINAQMDGVDPTDLSPNGRATYLCYIKRQQLRFLESASVIMASADPGKDVTKAVEQLRKIILPTSPDQLIRDVSRKQARILKDKDKVFRKIVRDDGSIAVRLVDVDN